MGLLFGFAVGSLALWWLRSPAAPAARSPSAERRPEVAYLAFLRAVGLGASLVGFLAWLSASRGLSWLSVAAALALAVLAVLIRARVAASEPLAWAGLAAFMGSAAASRLRAR